MKKFYFSIPDDLPSSHILIHSPCSSDVECKKLESNKLQEYSTDSSIFIIRFIGVFKPGGNKVDNRERNGCYVDTIQQNHICVVDNNRDDNTRDIYHKIFVEHTRRPLENKFVCLKRIEDKSLKPNDNPIVYLNPLCKKLVFTGKSYNEIYNESKLLVDDLILQYRKKKLTYISPSNTPLMTTLTIQSLNRIPYSKKNISLMRVYVRELIKFLEGIECKNRLVCAVERSAWFFHYFAFFYFYYSINADKQSDGKFAREFDKCQPSMFLRAGDCEDIALILTYVSDFIVEYQSEIKKKIENFEKWLKSVCSGSYVVCLGNYDASSTENQTATHCVAYLHPADSFCLRTDNLDMCETYIIDASFNATVPLNGLKRGISNNSKVYSIHQDKHEKIRYHFEPSERNTQIKNSEWPYEYFYYKGSVYKFEKEREEQKYKLNNLKFSNILVPNSDVVRNILAYQLPLNFRGESLCIPAVMKSYKDSGVVYKVRTPKISMGKENRDEKGSEHLFSGTLELSKNLHTQLGL
tara:strand:- start:1469 stop:3037 length:1569 start_codon:yes stop_codon:yes gene_type:complete